MEAHGPKCRALDKLDTLVPEKCAETEIAETAWMGGVRTATGCHRCPSTRVPGRGLDCPAASLFPPAPHLSITRRQLASSTASRLPPLNQSRKIFWATHPP
ncbi:hypothetical protein PGT21_021694 [Puccinia graminis f. sp. tritici]|uniref:Uncharacterized protein n=1 Tax=Puccinia graminis f. sp. tritici TaxID=56615 RepID=A0A5B0QTT5_PUCGR|nr:hypothetical protein PGT21_021694 [Puccinia graminis f. sp. tritici]